MDQSKQQVKEIDSDKISQITTNSEIKSFENKIEEDLKILNSTENKKYHYEYFPDKKMIIFKFAYDHFQINATFDLSKNYPLSPPYLNVDSPNHMSLLELNNINIEEILQIKWMPSITLEEVARKVEGYLSDKFIKKVNTFPLVAFFNEYKATNLKLLSLVLIITISIILRFGIGLAGYSGVANPPGYGDYEVHRHWMELAVSLNPSDWYNVTKHENIDYKHFDYPPFCAYIHWGLGHILKQIEPKATEFDTSRGFESQKLKFFMRWAIIFLDTVFYMSSLIIFIKYFFQKLDFGFRQSILFLLINMPTLLLIDHGHFQPNCVMLGLMTFCFYAAIKHQNAIAAILFVLSFNFKVFSVYFFVPIAIYITHNIIITSFNYFYAESSKRSNAKKACVVILFIMQCAVNIFKLIFLGMLIQVILFYPWIVNQGVSQVLKMIFPVERGLYEDKVANLWCFLNFFIKLREKFSSQILSIISGLVTLAISFGSIFPGLKKINQNSLLLMLFNVSMVFFLCSYMVHEKTILIPLLPFGLAFLNFRRIHTMVNTVALFSNFFLLRRDGCTIPYFAILFGYWIIGISYENSLNSVFHIIKSKSDKKIEGSKFTILMYSIYEALNRNFQRINYYVFGFIVIFHLIEAIVPAPSKLPDIYLVLCTLVSFFVFSSATFYSWLMLYLNSKNAIVIDYSLQVQNILKNKFE